MDETQVVKKPRGFAAISKELQREIASKGGKAAHLPGGGAHKFTHEEAVEAGRKGGLVCAERKRAERARVPRGLGG